MRWAPTGRRLPLLAGLLALAMGAGASAFPQAAPAQRTVPIRGDRLSGFVLPIEPRPAEITLSALRGWAWDADDTRRLLLEDDVEITVGSQSFVATRAVVWLNRLPTADGLVNQIAVYFDRVTNPVQEAGVGVEGRRLLVTASARGPVRLSVSLLERRRPRLSTFIRQAEHRLADHLRRLLAAPPALQRRPRVDDPPRPDAFRPVPGGAVREADLVLPAEVALPTVEQDTPPLIMPSTLVRFAAGAVEFTPGEDENIVTATGGLVVEYVSNDPREDFSQVTLSARRGVIFARPGTLEAVQASALTAESVEGIYLEGNVQIAALDGDYYARAPHVYYDFRTGQAIMLEAVLRTYMRDANVPVYARAEEMRQIASNQWEARTVRVSTSEFFTPHLSIGAERMTITRRPARADPDRRETRMVSEGNTIRAGHLPIFFWPRFAGTARDVPLRGIRVGGRDQDGVSIQTRWDLFAVLGEDPPAGATADLLLDGFTERGPAVGLDYRYDGEDGRGTLDLYGLYDQGTDKTSAGLEVDPGDDVRGVALWEHQARLSRTWELQAQAAWISDETFISSRREDDFDSRREYETAAYLRSQGDNSSFTALGKYALNDFISNDWLLASRQLQVDRLPEVTYRRLGDSWGDVLTYSGHVQATRMRFVFPERTPREMGVRGRAFGIGDDEELSEVLRARGLDRSWVGRFDTRHELAMPATWGIFKVVPFVVGRLTAYSDDFEGFSSDPESQRLFGAAGVRVSTELQRVDDSVESRALDLHRLRHVVEPNVTLWYGYSDVNDGDLPPYDPAVESIGGGSMINLGVRNTWQTYRGGPGRWRSVDVLRLDANVVFDFDTRTRSPVPQVFDYRPEHSQFGDHVRTAMVWLLSDSVSVAGEQTIDVDESAIARGSIGAELRHSPVLSTYVEYRYIDVSDNQLLDVGWNYRLSPKYHVRFTPQWDFRFDEFRAVTLRVTRRFPDVDLSVVIRHDEIRDETSFGASLDLVEF